MIFAFWKGHELERKARILIVDDEAVFCGSLAAALQKLGYETYMATNGQKALDLIRKVAPDLMTLDIMMPGESMMPAMNGLHVLTEMRKTNKTMPVIIISAAELAEDEGSFISMGAQAVHRKPVDFPSLFATIGSLLDRRLFKT